jgi:hypothetical protein
LRCLAGITEKWLQDLDTPHARLFKTTANAFE